MSQFVKATPNVCAMCKYRSSLQENGCCNYWNITGHSRIYVDGKEQYDPAYCDKFERGQRIPAKIDLAIAKSPAAWPWGYCPEQE